MYLIKLFGRHIARQTLVQLLAAAGDGLGIQAGQ